MPEPWAWGPNKRDKELLSVKGHFRGFLLLLTVVIVSHGGWKQISLTDKWAKLGQLKVSASIFMKYDGGNWRSKRMCQKLTPQYVWWNLEWKAIMCCIHQCLRCWIESGNFLPVHLYLAVRSSLVFDAMSWGSLQLLNLVKAAVLPKMLVVMSAKSWEKVWSWLGPRAFQTPLGFGRICDHKQRRRRDGRRDRQKRASSHYRDGSRGHLWLWCEDPAGGAKGQRRLPVRRSHKPQKKKSNRRIRRVSS